MCEVFPAKLFLDFKSGTLTFLVFFADVISVIVALPAKYALTFTEASSYCAVAEVRVVFQVHYVLPDRYTLGTYQNQSNDKISLKVNKFC